MVFLVKFDRSLPWPPYCPAACPPRVCTWLDPLDSKREAGLGTVVCLDPRHGHGVATPNPPPSAAEIPSGLMCEPETLNCLGLP